MNSIEPVVPLPPGERERGTARRRALEFATVFAILLGALSAWALFRGRDPERAAAFAGLGLVIVGYALVHPAGMLVLRTGWLRLGTLLGRVNSTIILSVIYIVLVTPLGLFFRIFGRRSFKPAPERSYFVARTDARDRKHFEHPY